MSPEFGAPRYWRTKDYLLSLRGNEEVESKNPGEVIFIGNNAYLVGNDGHLSQLSDRERFLVRTQKSLADLREELKRRKKV